MRDFDEDPDVTAECPGCGKECNADEMVCIEEGTYLCDDCWESGRMADEDEAKE